ESNVHSKKQRGDIVELEINMMAKYLYTFVHSKKKKKERKCMFAEIQEAIEDLQSGKIIIVVEDENRENEGDFVATAETITPALVNFMAKEGRGLICTPIETKKAKELNLPLMTTEMTDALETAFTINIDHKSTDTGISAFERSFTIQQMMNEDVVASDFVRPGHVFPLIAKENGVLERKGHTEAAVDLAKLAGTQPAGVICEIMNEDGTMARVPDLKEIATKFDLKMITIDQLITYRQKQENVVQEVACV